MPLKQGSNAPVTKLPFQQQDKPALGAARKNKSSSDLRLRREGPRVNSSQRGAWET